MLKIKDFIELFKENSILTSTDCDENSPVGFISYNSQDLKADTLFFCKGAHFKEQFLLDALKNGATAYVSEKKYNTDAPCILVSDIRKSMYLSANFFYNNAWDKLNLVGITGTKGKSTTAYFIKYIEDEYLTAQGLKKSAIVSSIDTYDGIINIESHLTTPEPFDLHKHFDNAVKSDIKHFTMEVSSQALKYGRTDGVNFTIGCYLNIGIDHISAIEHPDFEDYFQSKMKIFTQCKTAVVNLDTDRSEDVLEASKNAPEVITFSTKNPNADVYGYNIRKDGSDTVFTVKTKDFDRDFTLTIPGLFNVENALCAIAVCVKLGIPEKYIYTGLLKARSSGRMEVYENADKRITAIVDYAHNRMSFENLFKSVRQEYPGRKVAIVFGCPGNKALIRRKDLGEIAGMYADMTYITEEDPGEEPLEKISKEVASFVESQNGKYKIIDDRGVAISTAINEMGADSVILITGKGNETRQKRGVEYIPCPTDVEYTIKALKEYDKKNGLDSDEKIKSVQDILPQLHKLHNKKIVIKLGGSCLDDETLMKNLLEDIALLTMVGAKIVVVHGGGKEISKTLDKMNLKSEFYEGYRVTGDEEMSVVEMVLSGSVNKKIVERFSQSNISAVGISGTDGNILTALPKYINGKALGRVGDISKVDTSLIDTLLEKDYTVVISPVGRCSALGTVNINADDAAGQIALALSADYLVYITDVNGIFLDSQNEKTALEHITIEKAKMLLDSGLAKGGMIPKIRNIINLIENGVKEVAILNGRVRYNIISEFIGAKTVGTVVTRE